MKILVICGATASGKTKLAVDCALKLNTEIVSADSQLIYKGLNVGTAKPSAEEMCGVRHHLIDVVEPTEGFCVSDYAAQAEPILDNLLNSGKIPVVCGGTGFYINSLLFDLSYGNVAADSLIREKYNKILLEKGKDYIYSILKNTDPESAEKISVSDTKRVIRALEIYEVSGIKKSEIRDDMEPKREYFAVALDYPREELYKRINKRVDEMFESGLLEEIENLLRQGINENYQCMQAIGYKEVLECLKNGSNQSTMRDMIKQNTRRYAKRQITFFKKLKGLIWLKPYEATAEKVLELMNEQS